MSAQVCWKRIPARWLIILKSSPASKQIQGCWSRVRFGSPLTYMWQGSYVKLQPPSPCRNPITNLCSWFAGLITGINTAIITDTNTLVQPDLSEFWGVWFDPKPTWEQKRWWEFGPGATFWYSCMRATTNLAKSLHKSSPDAQLGPQTHFLCRSTAYVPYYNPEPPKVETWRSSF